MLEARHLSRRFHGITVVHDVSFVLRPGEVLGYLGPNGSGKTTTLRMLTGGLDPSDGVVAFEGRDVAEIPIELRRRIGYVPEEPHLYPFLSGRDYLELVGRLREIPQPLLTRKIDGFLELFGLAEAGDQDIAAYSKGMKQKVLVSAILLAVTLYAQAGPPFVSSYLRRGNVKSLGPIFALIVLAVSFSVAMVERAASRTTRGVLVHTAVLIAILVAVRVASVRRGAQSAPLPADAPEPTAQTLGLSG